uniref:Uncharacterized protein n=1 Tax=Oryza glumipatula TaxID=40148 RepID=A0A0D9YRI8_9ORYZ
MSDTVQVSFAAKKQQRQQMPRNSGRDTPPETHAMSGSGAAEDALSGMVVLLRRGDAPLDLRPLSATIPSPFHCGYRWLGSWDTQKRRGSPPVSIDGEGHLRQQTPLGEPAPNVAGCIVADMVATVHSGCRVVHPRAAATANLRRRRGEFFSCIPAPIAATTKSMLMLQATPTGPSSNVTQLSFDKAKLGFHYLPFLFLRKECIVLNGLAK